MIQSPSFNERFQLTRCPMSRFRSESLDQKFESKQFGHFLFSPTRFHLAHGPHGEVPALGGCQSPDIFGRRPVRGALRPRVPVHGQKAAVHPGQVLLDSPAPQVCGLFGGDLRLHGPGDLSRSLHPAILLGNGEDRKAPQGHSVEKYIQELCSTPLSYFSSQDGPYMDVPVTAETLTILEKT